MPNQKRPKDREHSTGDITSGRKITRNSILNIAGFCAPLLVAFFTIPAIVHIMGTDRFGILTLAWAIIGYFSLFDFGINRALIKFVAEKLGRGENEEIPPVIITALAMMLVLGLIVAVLLVIFLPWLVHNFLSVPASLQKETVIAFYLLAFSLPVVVASVGLKGILSAYQRFDLVNWVRVPMGIYFFLAPLIVVKWYANALHPVIAVLVCGRLLAVVVQTRFCLHIVPGLCSTLCFRKKFIRPLLTYGGWVTVSNMIAPLMVYIDRFFIASLISASAVAFYATPNEAITKLWYLPWALLGVLFPAFSMSLANDKEKAEALFENSLKYLFTILFPIALLLMTFAHESLYLWLGIDFAEQSTALMQWMAVGVFLHGMAQVPYALLQGGGRPDIIARLHLIELPVYCVLLWQLIQVDGMTGAAMAWTLRMGIDGLMALFFVKKVIPGSIEKLKPKLLILLLSIISLALAANFTNLCYKIIFVFTVFFLFAVLFWFILFSDEERARILKGIFNVS